MYSDIVELSPVGTSQVPIMGISPIQRKFKKNGHWVFNQPWYVRVRDKNIKTITMRISTETGEEFFYPRRCGHLSPQLSPATNFGLGLYKKLRIKV